MAPSSTKGALIPSWRRPATNVVVFQCPQGTLPTTRCPRGPRPRRRAILVLVPVSSTKTSRAGSSSGWLAFQRSRAAATSGRSCSAACTAFFERDPVTVEKAPDRALRDCQPHLVRDPTLQLGQRQVRLASHEVQEPGGMWLQRRTALPASRTRRNAAHLLLQRRPSDRRRRAHLEPRRRLPPRHPGRDLRNHPLPQIYRTGRPHRHLPNQRLDGISPQPLRESPPIHLRRRTL